MILADTATEGAWWAPVAWSVVAFLIIVLLGRLALSHSREKLPRNPITLSVEHAVLWLEEMCVGVIGPHGRKYVTFIVTIYFVVLISNLMGLIGLVAPTASFGMTFGMAVLVIVYVQEEGIRSNGLGGYVKHFFGPPLGGGAFLLITGLLFLIEVTSEIAKMLSLSLRLQGNIHGGHQAEAALGNLVHVGNFGVPVQTLLVPLGVFECVVQALVFTMLACVYLNLMTFHEAGHAEAAH